MPSELENFYWTARGRGKTHVEGVRAVARRIGVDVETVERSLRTARRGRPLSTGSRTYGEHRAAGASHTLAARHASEGAERQVLEAYREHRRAGFNHSRAVGMVARTVGMPAKEIAALVYDERREIDKLSDKEKMVNVVTVRAATDETIKEEK